MEGSSDGANEEKPRIELPAHTKIRLGYSEIQGRGVFATGDIEEGELIERCPMVPLSWRMKYHHDPVIWKYCFTHSCPCPRCDEHGGLFLMVLGYGQIYNHQDANNAKINFDLKNSVADIVALESISKGSEIFVNYGKDYFKNRKHIVASQSKAEKSV
jgi:hypothetical protein